MKECSERRQSDSGSSTSSKRCSGIWEIHRAVRFIRAIRVLRAADMWGRRGRGGGWDGGSLDCSAPAIKQNVDVTKAVCVIYDKNN